MDIQQRSGSLCAESSFRRRMLVMVGISIFVTVIVLVALSLATTSDTSSCQLIGTQPSADQFLPGPMRSQDNKALLRFQGFLKFAKDSPDEPSNYKYLDLKPIRVEHSLGAYDTGYRNNITIYADCATICIHIDKDIDAEAYYLRDFTIQPLSSKSGFDSRKTYPYDLKFALKYFYSCYKYTKFDCPYMEHGKFNQISLITRVLDLELDGDPANVRQGVFDKEPSNC